MLRDTLTKLIDDGQTSAREIGELTGVAPSTVYRWLRGDSQPEFDAVRLLVRHLKNPKAVEAILIAFIAGAPWRFQRVETPLDVNRDGVVDANDALDSAITAVRGAARSLDAVRESARSKGGIDREAAVGLLSQLNDVIRSCAVTQQILAHLTEPNPRLAKPLHR